MKPACVKRRTMCSTDWSSLIVTTPKHAIIYGTASSDGQRFGETLTAEFHRKSTEQIQQRQHE
jgi:hypothetical protein